MEPDTCKRTARKNPGRSAHTPCGNCGRAGLPHMPHHLCGRCADPLDRHGAELLALDLFDTESL